MKPFFAFVARHPVASYIAASVFLALLFIAAPGLDTGAAGLFYKPGSGFFLKDTVLPQFSYHLIIRLRSMLYMLAAFLILAHFIPALRVLRIRPAAIACIVLSFALGPGLVTNALLKNEMGRARPSQVVEFGGTKAFTPAAVPADQCDTNCSFVTGHGGFAYGFAVFAFLLPMGMWRRRALIAAIVFGSLVGLGRMTQGGHWLSDVIFAGLVNIGVAWVVCEFLDRRGWYDRTVARLRLAFSDS